MKRIFLAFVVAAACGTSPEDRRDENKKWSELQVTVRDVYKLHHECDAEQSAYEKASGAATEALGASGFGLTYKVLDAEKDKALAYLTACQKRQADYIEDAKDKASYGSTSRATWRGRAERLEKALDAWLDACIKCGKAQDCVARYREARHEQRKDYDRRAVCR